MGEWYVQEQCIGKKQSEISLVEGESDTNILVKTCCSVEALFSCHYRDKPSKKPCRDSPPIDKGKPSFWNDESWAAVQKSLEDASKGA